MNNLKYYEKVDSKLKLIPLSFDAMFKAVFANNKKALKKFLLLQLNLDMKPEEVFIDISNNELLKELNEEYHKTVDIIVYINDKIITNIEANTSRYKYVRKRNYFYFAKIHSLLLKEGDDPKKPTINELYQLNINSNELNNKYGEDKFEVRSNITGKPLIENYKILSKNIEYYRNLYYNENEKLTEAGMWLVALSSKTFSELYLIISKLLNEDEVKEFMESVIIMSGSEPILTEFERQRLEAIKEMSIIENATKEGKEAGKEVGKKEGIEIGRQEKTTEIAKRMLKENFNIKDIAKITGLTEKEIEDLK